MCLVFIYVFSPPPALPPLFSFFPFFREVGGGRERWQNSRSLEVCPIPALNSAPQLLWFETGRVSVSFSLSRFPPSLRTPLSAHLSSVTFITALHGSLPLGRCWKSQQGEFTRRIMTISPACSQFT